MPPPEDTSKTPEVKYRCTCSLFKKGSLTFYFFFGILTGPLGGCLLEGFISGFGTGVFFGGGLGIFTGPLGSSCPLVSFTEEVGFGVEFDLAIISIN
jgi:hypothetical protein